MNIQSKYIRIFTFILFFYGVVGLASAQVLTTNPSFPTLSSSLTITFDASLGNGGLDGFTGDVYAHTGVITDKSTSPADWKYVQGSWGTANAPKMTSIGGDKYTLTISDITAFYSVPNGEVVEQIAILFRNEAGNKVGRASDGGDMYIEVFSSGLFASIKTPEDNSTYSVGETVSISGESSVSASLRISLNGAEVKTGTGTTPGDYQAVVKASASGSDAYDTVNYVIVPTVTEEAFPTGNKLGINYKSSTSILLGLHAPYKSNVFVIGDFNDWKVNTSYFMKKDASNSIWWIEITGLEAGKKYAFQYLVDGEIKIADPFSELVLDPSNDKYIDAETYPNPHPYPTGKTTGIATLIEMDRSAFEWKTTGFSAPAENDLVVYELLVRDFVKKHNYATLLDTLDYLENLGVNAIELMPVNEFEGNNSWGYNPSFHMALDKYYGTPESFKRFVDECHKRGIAIILDVVYNHAFSQSPLCQLYWNATDFRPSSQSPYANEQAKHDFNVGYDLNHESPAIERFLKQVMEYWLTEYKVDGFRFDLSKGFTQNNTLGNVGAWGAYDTKRVENIKRIYDEVKAVNSDAYVILEHFSDNSEEKDLANYGCMFWGNLNHEATEGAMGYNSNFSGAYHGNRGWNNPKVLAFA
ncbi:MAG: alpha-amylase family glycosyl hydrolase, partial [Bacteroidia bacterium]